jgi:DNA helicase-2/ATP-dependent DNA helicase PcrA
LPGIHLLSGYIGKGAQFNQIVVVGAADGVISDFRAKITASLEEV